MVQCGVILFFFSHTPSFTVNSLLFYGRDDPQWFHKTLFSPDFFCSEYPECHSVDQEDLQTFTVLCIRKVLRSDLPFTKRWPNASPSSKRPVLRVHSALPWAACIWTLLSFSYPAEGRDVVGKICGTLCHEPLFISLFSWSIAYICSKLAFQENAFQVKATMICLTTLKLFCFLWPEWDHELFFFCETPSKYYMTLRIIHCMQESERHRRHCACPWKI